MFWSLLGAMLAYEVIKDTWDCFGFGCDDMCEWLGKVAQGCKDRRKKRAGTTVQSTESGALPVSGQSAPEYTRRA